MAFLGKEYSFVKEENFADFLKFVGIPADKLAAAASFTPPIKFEKSGDSYVFHSHSFAGPKTTTFSSGVEYDDVIGIENVPIKSKFVVDGNTVIQTITSDKGCATLKREFIDNDLILTITADTWDGVAKRYYKA